MVKILSPSFEILTPIDSNVVLKHIERCGRTCYQSFDKIDDGSAERFAAHIVERHHESVIEHFSISVKFITDRGVSHELVRHRLAAYSQESTRYCCYAKNKFQNEISVIKPVQIQEGTPAYDIWLQAVQSAEGSYLKLVQSGEKAENARAVLPTCLKTEIVMTANIREWRHVFKMRCDPAAHPDIRALMIPLREEFKKKIPVLFEDLV